LSTSFLNDCSFPALRSDVVDDDVEDGADGETPRPGVDSDVGLGLWLWLRLRRLEAETAAGSVGLSAGLTRPWRASAINLRARSRNCCCRSSS